VSPRFTCPRRTVLERQDRDLWYLLEGKSRCSYCGSLKPSEVLARIAAGEPVTPTDKTHKVYLGAYERVYFQHFSEDDCKEFVRLYNLPPDQGSMQIATPGYFYRLPYFMRYKPTGQ
jgi:succinate dehydrogenase flavin-adding protein (antitoxin of CptAB toxin-antitoxin module)